MPDSMERTSITRSTQDRKPANRSVDGRENVEKPIKGTHRQRKKNPVPPPTTGDNLNA